MNLFYSVSDTQLTLWWDQAAQAGAWYTVLLNNEIRDTVSHTHCTICGLQPGESYPVCVKTGDTLIGEELITMAKTPRRLNVRDFGAAGDGRTMDTAALQAALDACGRDEEVWFPAGTYLTGALRLHSDMKVHLDRDATIQGTANPEDYLPKIWSRFEGVEQECYQSLLNLGTLDHAAGPNCRNVFIYGVGKICGGGQTLAMRTIETERERLKDYLAALGDKVRECENDDTIPGRARGRLINLSNCENIRISGLTLENGASWNVHMIYSRKIITDHCTFRSEEVWNGDGWDPDSSENCTLFACEFHTGDDSVAIKSGKNPEGNAINRPTRNIRIFDCKSAFGLGIAIGSEMSGGVEDVHIWDCDLEHSLYGIQIKGTKKRGGYVRNITVRDCRLSRFLCCAVLYNDDGEGSPVPPIFSDMVCERVHLTGWARNYWEPELHAMPCIDLTGFDVPGYEARNLRFIDCTMGKDATIVLRHCREISMDVEQTE